MKTIGILVDQVELIDNINYVKDYYLDYKIIKIFCNSEVIMSRAKKVFGDNINITNSFDEYSLNDVDLLLLSSKYKDVIKYSYINNIIEKSNINVKYLYDTLSYDMITPLKEIKSKIVNISGLGINGDKFAIALKIKKILDDENIKSCIISSTGLELDEPIIGFPYMIFENNNFKDIINKFNDFIYKLSNKYDVIILVNPLGIIPIDEKFNNDFGYYSYIISNAVRTDFLFLSIYGNYYTADDLEKIGEKYENLFNCKICSYIISSNIIDILDYFKTKKISFLPVSKEIIEECQESYNKSSIKCYTLSDFNIDEIVRCIKNNVKKYEVI